MTISCYYSKNQRQYEIMKDKTNKSNHGHKKLFS